jgi:hypothetical protein
MTLKKILHRLAVVPLAYVTALGACGDEMGVNEMDDVAPITAPDPKTPVPFIPGAAHTTFEAVPPAESVERRSPLDERIGKDFDRRIDDRVAPFNGDLFIDADFLPELAPVTFVVAEVDAGTPVECADGSVACNGACVDLTADGLNCGACGTVCGDTESCQSGACTAGCEE